MSKISIRGVIVPSEFDWELFSEDVDKGIVTPLSRVEKWLSEASTEEPLELYINSRGGSVFAGHEMKNAVVNWMRDTGQKVNVTVGAMSASAASTIAVALGPVRAHRNALFMFHSARSIQLGGPEAMQDMKTLLNEINSQVMTALSTRYSFGADQVAEWFREERMGWVNVFDANAAGLVREIIDEDGAMMELDEGKLESIEQSAGMQIAAMVEPKQTGDTEVQRMELKELAKMLGFEKPEEATEEQVKQAMQDAQEAKKKAADDAYSEGYEAGKQENFATRESELKEQHKQEVEKVTQERDTEKQSREQAERQLKAVQNERDKAHQRIAQLDKGFQFDGSGDDPDSGDATADQYWQEVDRLVKDEGCSEEQAQLRAKDTHGEAYQKMIDEANAK